MWVWGNSLPTGTEIACLRVRRFCYSARQLLARTTVSCANASRHAAAQNRGDTEKDNNMAQHATTLPEQHTRAIKQYPRNVGDLERGLSLIGGAAVMLYGLRRSLGNMALMLGGG